MRMTRPGNLIRAVLVGLLVAIGTGLVTVPVFKAGLAPMPEAPSLAFAKTIFGPVDDPIGLVFHVGYVTAMTSVFLILAGPRPSLAVIAGMAVLLYVLAIGMVFPIVGWGVAGLAVSPKIAIAAIGPHVLYGLVLWGADRAIFGPRGTGDGTVYP